MTIRLIGWRRGLLPAVVWVMLGLLPLRVTAYAPSVQGEPPVCCGQKGERKKPHRFNPAKFRQELSAFVTREAGLSDREAKAFFPAFFEMKEKVRSLEHQKGRALRQAATGHMSEKDCQRVLKGISALDKKVVRVEEQYTGRLSKIIGARKLVKVMSADRKFGRRMFRMMTKK